MPRTAYRVFTGVRAEEEMEAAIKSFLLEGTLLPS
jgi:hypothetical protein